MLSAIGMIMLEKGPCASHFEKFMNKMMQIMCSGMHYMEENNHNLIQIYECKLLENNAFQRAFFFSKNNFLLFKLRT